LAQILSSPPDFGQTYPLCINLLFFSSIPGGFTLPTAAISAPLESLAAVEGSPHDSVVESFPEHVKSFAGLIGMHPAG
jgi:hypothetical protein